MTKTLKQILGEKPILFTADVPERVKEWLMQKRQEMSTSKDWGLATAYVFNELLEELQ